MSVVGEGRPNLKISCDNNQRSSEIQFVDADDEPDEFPYRCICQKDPCECGCSDITEEDIYKIFESLGIENRDKALLEGIRLNTIHVWGTAELSSEDILGFFGEYNPQSIEWINDDMCNVVFERESSAFRALLNLSEMQSVEAEEVEDEEEEMEEMEEADRAIARILTRAGEMPMVDYDEAEAEAEADSDADVDPDPDPPRKRRRRTENRVELPAGRWRQAVTFPEKADLMCMRYALPDDRKRQGAERFSHYYRRHGNPNFGGVKGIISDSYRRRMRAARRPTSPTGENTRDVNVDGRTAVSYGELYSDPGESEDEDRHQSEEEPEVKPEVRPTARAMRMKADEEEEERKDRKIHSRLGGRRVASKGDRRNQHDLRHVLSRRKRRRSRDRSPMDDLDGKGRLRGRLGPQSDDRNPGSDFMRRRKDFYYHDDRREPNRSSRPRVSEGRWQNDKFFDSD